MAMLLLPMALIFLNTGVDYASSAGWITGKETWVQAFDMLGQSGIALLISVLVALIVLRFACGDGGRRLEVILDSSIGPIASVVFITGAGGMYGGVLRTTGIGDALAETMDGLGVPVIIAAYVIALLLRIAQGSATVALTTAAGLMAPAVFFADFSDIQVVAITLATAAGSVGVSHVNDSGFWLVGRLFGMDVSTTLRVWTVQQTLESVIAFALACVLFVVF